MKKYISLAILISIILLAACSPEVVNTPPNDISNNSDNSVDDTVADDDVEDTNDEVVDDEVVGVLDDVVTNIAWSALPAGEFIGAEYAGMLFRSSEESQEGAWIVDSEGTARHIITEGDDFIYNPETFMLAYLAPAYEEDIHILNIATGESIIVETPDILEGSLAFVTGTNLVAFNYMTQENLGPWSGFLGAYDYQTDNYMILDDQRHSNKGFVTSPRDATILYDDGGLPLWYSQETGPVDVPMDVYAPDFSSFGSPAFSPDGYTLTFTAYGNTTDPDGNNNGIVAVDTLTGTSKILHPYFSAGQRVGPEIAWSPNGNQIAIVTQGEVATNTVYGIGLWIIDPNSDGADDYLIGEGNGILWSPDGASLLYVDYGTGSYLEAKIMLVSASDFSTSQVPLPAGAFPFQWIDISE
jgi:hypothetical protein